jgi:hypothetical protein
MAKVDMLKCDAWSAIIKAHGLPRQAGTSTSNCPPGAALW